MRTAAEFLGRQRRAATLVLWTERLLPAMALPASIFIGYVCACLVGLIGLLPPLGRLVVLVVCLLSGIVVGRRRLAGLHAPARSEIDRLLECRGGLMHRPLATLADRPASGGEDAVWQAHRERALAQLANVRSGLPAFGLRALVGLAVLVGALSASVVIAGGSVAARLYGGFVPFSFSEDAAPARLQAWILPPLASGLPPVFLNPRGGTVSPLPAGSHLQVSVVGGSRALAVSFDGRGFPVRRLSEASFQADLVLQTAGQLEVRRSMRRLASWKLDIVADQPPSIRLSGPKRIATARLVIPWEARDDFGLASVQGVLTLRARSGVPPLTIDLPLPGVPRSATGGTFPDLTDQPWAGLKVSVHMQATDTAGHRVATPDIEVDLPERMFLSPFARKIIEVRRRLVVDPSAAAEAVAALDLLSLQAEGTVPIGQWLNLRAAAGLLQMQPKQPGAAEARLWQLALAIEDGGSTEARQRLAKVRERLREALAAPASAAQQGRISALTRELDDAIRSFLQALAQHAASAGAEASGGRLVDDGQVQQMTRDLANAAKAGRVADAATRLQQLGSMLDNLGLVQFGQSQAGPGKPADPALEALMKDQRTLRDRTERRLGATDRASAGDLRRQRQQDAEAQAGLRGALGTLAERLGENRQSVPGGLVRADGAMRDAARALSTGDDAEARVAQQRAAEALQAGADELGAQLGKAGVAKAAVPGQDPFGRAPGTDPDEGIGSLQLGGDPALSRQLRDELRRRAAERLRQPQELDYFGRLLKTQ